MNEAVKPHSLVIHHGLSRARRRSTVGILVSAGWLPHFAAFVWGPPRTRDTRAADKAVCIGDHEGSPTGPGLPRLAVVVGSCLGPVKYLPKGVREGHHPEVGFRIDQAATNAQREKVRGVMEELLKRGKEQ